MQLDAEEDGDAPFYKPPPPAAAPEETTQKPERSEQGATTATVADVALEQDARD